MSSSTKTYTILHGDGLYPDDTVEQEIFHPSTGGHDYKVNYVQANLWTVNDATPKPWTSIDKSIRDQVDGITLQKPYFGADDLELFPNLKVIVRMGVGYDSLDRAALAKRGVTVCNIPDYGTNEVADHAFAQMLSLRRAIALYHDTQRSTPPAKWGRIESPLIARLQEQTFGILGLGRIGIAVAQRAKAFGCKVIVYDPYVPAGLDRSLAINRVKDVRDLFRQSTIVSLHVPSTRLTRRMVNYDLLSLMPKGSVLINTARGEVVDLDGVERCLKENILSGVGMDVLPDEPIREDNVHPLIKAYRDKEDWLTGRMVLSPHSAWHSPESLEDIRTKSAETIRDVLIHGLLVNVIPPDQE